MTPRAELAIRVVAFVVLLAGLFPIVVTIALEIRDNRRYFLSRRRALFRPSQTRRRPR